MEDSKTLGARIQAHRRRMGLSQEQLAERLGVSRQAVSKWELEGSLLRFDGLSISKRGGKFYHSAHSLCQLQVALLFLCPKMALWRAMHAVFAFCRSYCSAGPRAAQAAPKPGNRKGPASAGHKAW